MTTTTSTTTTQQAPTIIQQVTNPLPTILGFQSFMQFLGDTGLELLVFAVAIVLVIAGISLLK